MTLAETPLRTIAAEHPAALRIFDRFQIDLCRMGDKSLAEACAALQLSAEQVQEKISCLSSFSMLGDATAHLPLAQIIQRIVRVYHRRVRQDLPALADMAVRLEKNHAQRNPENIPLARLASQLHREMFDHIGREEQVLFPFIVLMEEESSLNYPIDHMCFRALRTPVGRMIKDHESATEILEELRQRTNDFKPTRTACGTKRAFYAGLKSFESDMHEHLNLENNILFPRAIALEEELQAKLQSGSRL